jgi:hypothetical protein
VLPLTPLPPQTDGERAFFNELVRWDTGNAVRGAVVAAIPFADGPLQRRLSDAILFVPEGIAVIRVAEVVRQTGVVTASPEGPWTIGPAGTGGAVLQLAGGGSTPLDGLMRAGMETAVRLRRAGLEPGRIARLTVLAGGVEGLLPADGDLGEGDHVAQLDTRSLLLGIARSSRYSGVDNPRLWTTADVRAALEALGLEGRGPTVEELNGEGFPYSPYVLRRPQLLTPAAMAAGPGAPPVEPPAPPPPAPPPPAAPQEVRPVAPSRASIDQAVAASVAAAHAAAAAEAAAAGSPEATQATPPAGPSATSPVPAAPPPGVQLVTPASAPPTAPARETVAIDGPPEPPADGGIGGLFAGGEPDAAPAPPRTAVLPAQQPPAAAAPAPAAEPPAHFWDRSAEEDDRADAEPGRGRRALLAVLALVLVLAGVGVGLALAGRDDGDGSTAAPEQPTEEAAPAGPTVGSVQEVGGVAFTVQAAESQESCAGRAYGQIATYFQGSDCTGLSRALYSAQVGGRDVVVSVARVRMPDTAAARDLRGRADTNGSGNVNDLLREGVRYPGGPEQLRSAEYASAVSGPTVTIVESAWVDTGSGGTEAEVDKIATDGLSLATPELPAG